MAFEGAVGHDLAPVVAAVAVGNLARLTFHLKMAIKTRLQPRKQKTTRRTRTTPSLLSPKMFLSIPRGSRTLLAKIFFTPR